MRPVVTSMAESPWYAYNNGGTVGQKGSESGVIVLDEEHELGARITLERATKVAPFSITCGIYGAMLHTCYRGKEEQARADYEGMKMALAALVPMADDKSDGGRKAFYDGLDEFVRRFS